MPFPRIVRLRAGRRSSFWKGKIGKGNGRGLRVSASPRPPPPAIRNERRPPQSASRQRAGLGGGQRVEMKSNVEPVRVGRNGRRWVLAKLQLFFFLSDYVKLSPSTNPPSRISHAFRNCGNYSYRADVIAATEFSAAHRPETIVEKRKHKMNTKYLGPWAPIWTAVVALAIAVSGVAAASYEMTQHQTQNTAWYAESCLSQMTASNPMPAAKSTPRAGGIDVLGLPQCGGKSSPAVVTITNTPKAEHLAAKFRHRGRRGQFAVRGLFQE